MFNIQKTLTLAALAAIGAKAVVLEAQADAQVDAEQDDGYCDIACLMA